MTPAQYAKRLGELDLTQESAGEFFGASPRTGQRWAAEGPPLAVAMVLLAVDDRKALDRLKRRAG